MSIDRRPNIGEKRKQFLAGAALAFIVYVSFTVLLTWPLVTEMDRYYFSPEVPGDGAGAIADSWYNDYARQHKIEGPVTRLYAYPFGYDTRGAPGYPLDSGLRNQLTRLFGPQAAFNLLIFFSFPLAGIAMFFLLFHVTGRGIASFLGGFLYAFAPWHTARAFDQVSLTGTYTLPLFVLALIFFWRRRDWWSAVFLAAASVLAVYTDFHFGLFCVLLAAAWVASALLAQSWRNGGANLKAPGAGSVRKTALLTVLVLVVVAAAAAPYVADQLYRDPAVFAGSQSRGGKNAADFSSNPWNYVVPPAHSFLWRGATDVFVQRHLGSRTSNEVTAYPGIVTFALAAAALVMSFGLRRRPGTCEPEGGDEEPAAGTDSRRTLIVTVVTFCVIAGLSAFILSLPPAYRVGSLKIPTPSAVVEAVVPLFRYFCRWAVVVTFSLCLLAGIGFSLIVERLRLSLRKTLALCLALLLLFVIDVSIVPPSRAKDMIKAPETLSRLGTRLDEPVAIYPLAQGYEYANLHYRYFQQFHLHPMLNGMKPDTRADLYRLSLKDIYSPYTARMLAGLGIKKVAVLDRYYSSAAYGNNPLGIEFDPQKVPPGLRLAATTPDGYVFDVVAEPARVFPLFYTNFTPPSILEGGRTWTVMRRPSADMLLVNKGPRATYSLTIDLINPGTAGQLTFDLNGRRLGELTLEKGNHNVTLSSLDLKPGDNRLSMHWDGKPVVIDGKPFRAGGELQAYLLVSQPELQEKGL
jgi:hypothetical protein